VKTLTFVVICFALALGFACAHEGSTVVEEDDPAVLIPKVQNTIAAKLDSTLPRVSFEEWIRQQIGMTPRLLVRGRAWTLSSEQ